MPYTVEQVAAMSGVRAHTGANGYRIHEAPQLLTPRQIPFYREPGFGLQDIRRLLDRHRRGPGVTAPAPALSDGAEPGPCAGPAILYNAKVFAVRHPAAGPCLQYGVPCPQRPQLASSVVECPAADERRRRGRRPRARRADRPRARRRRGHRAPRLRGGEAVSSGNRRRRLAGVVRNAVVWGVAWFALAFATILGLRTIGVVVPPTIGVLDAIGMAIRIGVVGGFAGGAFAAFISLFYRGRRLSEINWVRFGIGGAIVAELFVLAFFAITSLGPGNAFPRLDDILSDLIIAAAFGGISAGASMWLAQRAEPAHGEWADEPAPLAGGDAPASLGAGDLPDSVGAADARPREGVRRPWGGDR